MTLIRSLVLFFLLPCFALAQAESSSSSPDGPARARRFVTMGRLDEMAYMGYKASLDNGARDGKNTREAAACAAKLGIAPFTDMLSGAALDTFTDAQIKEGTEFFAGTAGKKFIELSLVQTWNGLGQTPTRPVPQLTAQEIAAINQFSGKAIGREVIDLQSGFEQAVQKRMVPIVLKTFDRCGIAH